MVSAVLPQVISLLYREEMKEVQKSKEPWSLPTSIFKQRARENDSRAFYDTASVLSSMMEMDWSHTTSKEKFTYFLAREGKVGSPHHQSFGDCL